MGGIDHYDLTSRSLALLDRLDGDLNIHVVVGPYFDNKTNIQLSAAKCHHRTYIQYKPESLASIIKNCGMAISVGGVALYKLTAFGVPTVGIWLRENQRLNVEQFGAVGAIQALGYKEGSKFDEDLLSAVKYLLEDGDKRRKLNIAGPKLIDGQGAHRIARAVATLSTAASSVPLKEEHK